MYKKYAEIRDEKGLTDAKVAEMSGVSQSVLSSWKHGRYIPKVEKISKIAKALEVTIGTLIGEEE